MIKIPEEKDNLQQGLQLDTSAIKEMLINFIVPLICVIAVLVLGITIIYPHYKNTGKVKQEIDQKTQLAGVLSKKVLNLKKNSDFKPVLDENTGLVDKALVSEPNVPQLLDEVFQIATNVGVTVTRLNYSYSEGAAQMSGSGAAATPEYKEVNVALGTEGSYDQVVTLLQNVENATRVLYIPSFRYTTDQEGKMSINYSILSPFLFVQSTAVTDEPVDLDVTTQGFVDFMNKLKSLRYYEFLNKDIQVIENEDDKKAAEMPTAATGTGTGTGTTGTQTSGSATGQ